MSRADLLADIANGYVAAQKYSGIEWQVQVGGKHFLSGQCGFADAHKQTPIPERAVCTNACVVCQRRHPDHDAIPWGDSAFIGRSADRRYQVLE